MNETKSAQDALLEEAAGRLLAAGEASAAAALIGSDLAFTFGTSWWDGHDDYIYDVLIVITATHEAAQLLQVAEDAVRGALGAAAGHFRDEHRGWTRGDLVKLDVVTGAVDVDEQRRLRRQNNAEKHAAARRRPWTSSPKRAPDPPVIPGGLLTDVSADLPALEDVRRTLPHDFDAIKSTRRALAVHAPELPLSQLASISREPVGATMSDAINRAPFLRGRAGVVHRLVPSASEAWDSAIRALEELRPLADEATAPVGRALGLLDDAARFLDIADRAISARIADLSRLAR